MYGSTTTPFEPQPWPSSHHASARIAAGFSCVIARRVRRSIAAAPSRNASISMPWSAAGTRPAADVTDVRQVKGLEFDYVIVTDPTLQNYPVTVASRHLLHIACTRTAYQLWLVCSGPASQLLPKELVASGELRHV